MSQAADVKLSLNQEFMREKLSVEERGQLLFDLDQDLEWDNYDSLQEAIEDVKRAEKQAKKDGM